ncbi:S8 family serine peptidase [Beggiatoa leptomitoformis]|uniref:S8 family serine peptidase n=1 Tax=Beggiatoa leptomitoformis TaxID=288004 RepID=A0A2N9YBT9_9GAMM|nr:S8 family serine peptidase [Beggiatoa leptomitoformis]AUI67950.1 S8 family serine peptidase [Beggiatoa leptomitoformis]QGX03484.1 S8 family serine peptidase [Beggiatoa leptomitoformis]
MKRKIIYLFFSCILFNISACNEDTASSTSSTTTGYTITGRITVSANTANDSDVNDVNAPTAVSNNTVQTAQSITNPVILGGYVNVAGAGSAGRSKTSGDTIDTYQVDLRTGQVINLFIGESDVSSNDLDLYLLDVNGQVYDASLGEATKTESLKVRANGRYYIQVVANAGASPYILNISQNLSTIVPASAETNALILSDDFATGEAIVKLDEENGLQAQSTLYRLGAYTENTDASRRMLFSFEPDSLSVQANSTDMSFADDEARNKYATLMRIKELRRQANVSEATPNYYLQSYRVPNDTYYNLQWHYDMINLSQAWDITTGSSNVIVAVIDTGVLVNHPELRDKITQGYDFIADRTVAGDGDGIDSNPNDVGDSITGGSSFHGSHVAGTIAANTNNGTGVSGVGWQTRIMPLRVLGRGGVGKEYDAEQAVRYAAGLSNDSGTVPQKRADIMNLSLGGRRISSGFQQAVTAARNAGVIVVAAAGNESTSSPSYPAALTGVISVSAVDINKRLASYSNYGSTIDLAAPGGDSTSDVDGDGNPDMILSTVGDDRSGSNNIQYSYGYSSGTSMASPHVSGVIALMKAANSGLTPQSLDTLISTGKITDDIGTVGRDDSFGYGLINAQKAVSAALAAANNGSTEVSAELVASPRSLNFGLSESSTTLTLSNGGTRALTVSSISNDSGGFLSVARSSVDSSGLGNYTVTISRSGLSAGTYSATITVKSSTNTLSIPVIMQVASQSASTSATAGHHYVLLIDPDTLTTIKEDRVNISGGVYTYRFTNVQSDNYIIVAGADIDNDGFICEPGEACGAYLTRTNPTEFDVTGNRSQLDFATGFNIEFNIIAASLSNVTDNVEIDNNIVVPQQGYALLKDYREVAE